MLSFREEIRTQPSVALLVSKRIRLLSWPDLGLVTIPMLVDVAVAGCPPRPLEAPRLPSGVVGTTGGVKSFL